MTLLDDVGEADGWRCWLCDEPVDPDMSVNDDRGPSVDSMTTQRKAKAKGTDSLFGTERLAHRGCNTKKGAVAPVVAWPKELFVADAASIITSVERLARKRGSEAMGRCPTEADAKAAAEWLVDRLSRLAPGLHVESKIQAGGGQYLVVLTS
ncbi:MAG TPA: hypothetical protein PLH92_07690 [Mycobacterium sp.]|uniref:hypothetical protein n=1 Tax=Mycolicibacterium sp. TaxID=2320850 RepID=UPI0025E143E4|nr:hypothetical protein [Mycolicibacterium sp.]HPX37584.1 hypothetical protein [Mycobacterium sp.]HQC76586.1 hypothetical protein [Mycobacterium sp.]